MRVSAGVGFVVVLVASTLAQATNVWSGCQTSTGVTNHFEPQERVPDGEPGHEAVRQVVAEALAIVFVMQPAKVGCR